MSGTFAGVFVALYVGHGIGDHWVQTSWQAANKHRRDWTGRWACFAHVMTYQATQAAALLALFAVTDRSLVESWWPVAGLAISSVTHYWADRRFTLAALCEWWPGGKATFYRFGQQRRVAGWTDTSRVRVREYDTQERVPHDNACLGTGAYVLDQWWHIGWLFVAALLISAGVS